jgi:trimethylamine--corrinoid protein Co-methyltransferase
MLVLCNEIISWIRAFKKGAPVTEDTMSLDLINQLGFSDDFLTSDHTLRHYRNQWLSDLFDRNTYDGWTRLSCPDLREKIGKRIAAILDGHTCRRLPARVADQLKTICERVPAPKRD